MRASSVQGVLQALQEELRRVPASRLGEVVDGAASSAAVLWPLDRLLQRLRGAFPAQSLRPRPMQSSPARILCGTLHKRWYATGHSVG